MYKFVFMIAVLISAKADYCQTNFTVAEIPGGILNEAIMLFLTGTLEDFVGCRVDTSVANEEVEFYLFTRSNPDNPILLNQDHPDQLDSSKPTIYLFHGWLCSIANDRMPELKDAYLTRYDANVIAVDWSKVSVDFYSTCFCRLPNVAKIIGKFICTTATTIDPSGIHVVGHSLGGQLCGLVGQEVQKQCHKTIGRITGLDPAGPLYQYQEPDKRLSAEDGDHVQVIHTNQGILGFFGPCGDVDFFPNCGFTQPGCFHVTNITTHEDIINLPLATASCDHVRSTDYMVESINPVKPFQATSCLTCPGTPIVPICIPDITFPESTVMGEDCPVDPPACQFHLKTNDKSPFARG